MLPPLRLIAPAEPRNRPSPSPSRAGGNPSLHHRKHSQQPSTPPCSSPPPSPSSLSRRPRAAAASQLCFSRPLQRVSPRACARAASHPCSVSPRPSNSPRAYLTGFPPPSSGGCIRQCSLSLPVFPAPNEFFPQAHSLSHRPCYPTEDSPVHLEQTFPLQRAAGSFEFLCTGKR
jgi:hypothetical protein